MDYLTFSFLFSFLLTLAYVITTSSRQNSRLPPGPFKFPIIGNLLQLGDKPHRSLATLAKRYGPLMSLKLGSMTTIVITSPDMAKEFFQTHDHSFSGRLVPDTARMLNHDRYSVEWLPADKQWRKLRKISKEYLFSMQRLDASETLRQQKIKELLDYVSRCCTSEMAVKIDEVAFVTTLNVLSNFMFSMNFAEYDSVSSQELMDNVTLIMEISGQPNISDFFPLLQPYDLQGLLRRGNVYGKKIMDVFDKIISQRLRTRTSSSVPSTTNDMLDILLDLIQKGESEFGHDEMKHLFLTLIIAGTDTTTSTLEWAMAELIRNPKKLERLRLEVNKLMETKKNIICESDISQLPYLQAVIKETFRLHPPGPLLFPHQAICDVEIQGFKVPKNAQILCNVWAIGRDPTVWLHPDTFMPERFLEVNIDYKGQNFKLIPFGAGRRMCPGMNIAERMLHIMLGSLIQKFKWKLEGSMRAEDMDMNEKSGLSAPRNVPLKVIPLAYNDS